MRFFNASLNPLNKGSRKLKNSYHVKFLNNLERLTIHIKGCIVMERAIALMNYPIPTQEPKSEKKRQDKKRDGSPKPDRKSL